MTTARGDDALGSRRHGFRWRCDRERFRRQSRPSHREVPGSWRTVVRRRAVVHTIRGLLMTELSELPESHGWFVAKQLSASSALVVSDSADVLDVFGRADEDS